MNSKKLMIIDGNSILNRAFYGLQGKQLLSTREGFHTNAIYGFLNMLNKYLTEEEPGYLCVAFDLKAPTFRHLEYERYKATRKGMPRELAEQLPVMKEILDAMNIKRLELEGYEADDIIGTMSLKAGQEGMQVIVVTGDRDALQLASDSARILIPVTRSGRTETEVYDTQAVFARYGVTPEQLIDVKGLMGDSSDNIPGVPGIGEKTALELVKSYGSLEKVYENIGNISKKSVKEKLDTNRELAFLSKRLSMIEKNVPGLCDVDELEKKEADKERLLEIFKKLEFVSLMERYGLTKEKKENDADRNIEYISAEDPIMLEQVIVAVKKAGSAAIFHLMYDDVNEKSNGAELAGMAVSWGNENAYIKIERGLGENQFLQQFRRLFEDSTIKLYGHGLKSLIVYLKWKGILFRGLALDTMIGAYILDSSRDTYSLPQLSLEYLGRSCKVVGGLMDEGKEQKKLSDLPMEKISEEAVRYSRTILELTGIIEKQIADNGQEKLFYDIELPLIEVLADMEYRGFKVNTASLANFSTRLDIKINQMENEIYKLAGESFNINSPKQLSVILFERLGLTPVKKTKTGFSTDAEVLEQLADKHDLVSRILEYRQLAKLKSTYVVGLLKAVNPLTGRIHSSFNQTVATTGRISSTEPNLQNIPIRLELGREIRKVFIPESEEYILTDADYSQIELRVLAHISGDENMISAFKDNKDIHTATASEVFKVAQDQVTPLLRSRAKAVNFGIVYGIGDFSLAKDIGITRKEARKYIDGYLKGFPGVRKYMHDTVEESKEKGYAKTLFNRRRYLPELKSPNFNTKAFGERVAMNMPIQGSAADIIKIAMVRVFNELNSHNMKSRLILQVHDELIIETYAEERGQVELILKNCMQNAVQLDVPLLVDIKMGASWYDTK